MAYEATPIFATKKRPTNGLVSVATPLPADLDWRRGVRWVPEGCLTPDTYTMCGPGSGGKPEPGVDFDVPTYEEFHPFLIQVPDACDDPWASQEELELRGQRVLLMGQSPMIAKELLSSTVDNPDLASEALDVSGGVAVDWEAGASALIYNMIQKGYVGDITLHAPPWLAPSFNRSGVGRTEDGNGQSYIGPHRVVFDSGYDGSTPPDTLAGADPVPGNEGQMAWVYATGPVEFAIGPNLDDVAIGTETRQNSRYVQGERPAIVRFDPCQVVACVIEGVCP